MSDIHFFAVDKDIANILDVLAGKVATKFTLTGLLSRVEAETWYKWSDLPGQAHISGTESLKGRSYLISYREDSIEARRVPQVDGMIKYAFDQMLNPATITFNPGGKFSTGVLLSGVFATCSPDVRSVSLMRATQRIICKNFRRINAYWLGNSAYAEFKSGSRLAASVDSPVEYDLRKM